MASPNAVDVARAARYAAAIKGGDNDGLCAVINEARRDDRVEGMCLALGVRLVAICDEYYDIDCQQILDMFAMDAMNAAAGDDDGSD